MARKTTLQVREEIRRLYRAGGVTYKALALRFGVSVPLIQQAMHPVYEARDMARLNNETQPAANAAESE